MDDRPPQDASGLGPRSRMIAAVRGILHPRQAIFGAAGWVTATYVAQQALRLGSNIILAWLLAPALLGTMLLINTLRTGGELLTDIGVGQSIVNHPRGNEPNFYNTAWTIQIVRGLLLFVLAMLLTAPIAHGYDNPELLLLLPAVAPIFIITGLTSPARFLLQKQLAVRKLALFDLASAGFGTLVQIGFALYMPTIWALIWGLLVSTAIPAVASFFLIDWRSHRLAWEREAVRAIVHFGKWIFLASLVYFLAMNFDRLYFADAIPLTLLGIYGIARTFSDTIMQLFQRLGSLLIFPRVSASALRGRDLQRAIGPMRLLVLASVSVSLAFGIAIADELIYLLYDDRYRAAGFFLTVLLVGTWFGIAATMADATMMGIGKPANVALSNGVKLGVIVAALPWVLTHYGINAALVVFVLAEALRYAMLTWRQRSLGLSFIRQDVLMLAIFVGLIFLFREATALLGFTDGMAGWQVLASVSHL
ncbi:oligosaccharide flippase family protein [Sphingopyxis bauzanensis]|nr:oligosaccharide flippase family protein [Sphingopyxis bauzanensis]